MDINRLNVSQLKKYLRDNGATNYSKMNKPELVVRAGQVKKARDLELVEQEICKHCGFSIDMCECERCDECVEVMKDCECEKLLRKEKIRKMEEMAGPYLQMFQKFKQMTVQPTKQQTKQQIPVKPITPQKKVVLKRIKKVVKIKPIVVDFVDQIVVKELPTVKTEIEKYDLETVLQIKSYKIKIKIFLLKNIIPEPNIHQDVFDLIDCILQKHNVILTDEEKNIFPKIFNRIYEEPNGKQKTILKDIVVYLVNCEFKSF